MVNDTINLNDKLLMEMNNYTDRIIDAAIDLFKALDLKVRTFSLEEYELKQLKVFERLTKKAVETIFHVCKGKGLQVVHHEQFGFFAITVDLDKVHFNPAQSIKYSDILKEKRKGVIGLPSPVYLVETPKTNEVPDTSEMTFHEVVREVYALDRVLLTNDRYEQITNQMFNHWLLGLKKKHPRQIDLNTMSVDIKFDWQMGKIDIDPSPALKEAFQSGKIPNF
jgi:hypothetical protein